MMRAILAMAIGYQHTVPEIIPQSWLGIEPAKLKPAEVPVCLGVRQMKGKLFVAVPAGLLDGRRLENLFGAHSFSTGSLVGDTQVLCYQGVYATVPAQDRSELFRFLYLGEDGLLSEAEAAFH